MQIYISIFPNVGIYNRLHLENDEISIYMNYFKNKENPVSQEVFVSSYIQAMKNVPKDKSVVFVSSNPNLRMAMLMDSEIKERLVTIYPPNTQAALNELLNKVDPSEKFYQDVKTYWNNWHLYAKKQCEKNEIPYFEVADEKELKDLIYVLKYTTNLKEFVK